MEETKTLAEVLKEYKGKCIKIGGKAGFFFCGYIRDNYIDLMNDIIEIESNRIENSINNTEITIKNADVYWNTIGLKKSKDKDPITIKKKKKDYISNKLEKLNRLHNRKEGIKDLLNTKVIDVYISTIDFSTIIVIDFPIVGSVSNRKDMVKKYKHLYDKYNI